MTHVVSLKSNPKAAEKEFADSVALTEASVVTLGFGPEQVARFDRVGDDLVLILQDGSRITIQDFFVTLDGERNEIVFVDSDEVMWWGQYDSPWEGFRIAEIERGFPPAAVGFAGLAGLPAILGGMLGVGALAGSGDSSDNVRPPEPQGDSNSVTEAGVESDGSTDTAGQPGTQGNVLTNDSDPSDSTLTVSGVASGNTVGTVGQPLTGLYGTLTINADGSYSYSLDNSMAATQALAQGALADEVFTISITNAEGGVSTAPLTITVQGTNDTPVISDGPQSAVLTEVDDPTAPPQSVSGQFSATDVDSDGDTQTWSVDGTPDATYGTFSVDSEGRWLYTLDEDLPATQALRQGETVTLDYSVRVTDAHGAFAIETVSITITGTNNTAVITGTSDGAIVEAGGLDNATPGQQSADGQLTLTDPDQGQDVFQMPDSLQGLYGTFTFDPDTGVWGYTLDDLRPATQALVQDEQATDSLLVTSADGTAQQTITITVTGTNDVPQITSSVGSVAEDSGNPLVTTGSLSILDLDADQSTFSPDSLTYVSGSQGGPVPLGQLKVNAAGDWRFSVDNDRPEVQALAVGEQITQIWQITSLDGTETGTVTITVTGTNDTPAISGTATGAVTEDSILTTTGQLAVADVDTTDTHTWSVPTPAGSYGSL
ncbi:VCBS domain-containing protein, partial [Rhodobacteraceae bacterium KMM 6894]|nr:VCBS domain-containing protein [Rhodobacteraceae bacterium KMM 6894]